MRIALVHPAPVRIVPRKARKARDVYERVTTPAVIHEASASDVRPFATLEWTGDGRGAELYEHDGGIWQEFVGAGGATGIPAAAVVAFLEGDPARISDWDMPRLLCLTPLHAWKPTPSREPSRGEPPLDVSGIGRIVVDGRDRARSRAAAFVADDLRLWNGTVLVRHRGPMAHGGDRRGGAAWHDNLYEVDDAPFHRARISDKVLDAVVRVQDAPVHLAFLRSNRWALELELDTPCEIVGLSRPATDFPGYDGDADLELACNLGLLQVLRHARAVLSDADPGPAAREEVGAAMAALDGHAMHAVVSGVRASDHADVLNGMDAVLSCLAAHVPGNAKGMALAARQAGWLRAHLLPRVAPPELDADADAIQGMVP